MYSHERMHALNELRSGCGVITIEVWMRATVHGFFAVDDLSEIG
jgi:hypothetical protein